MVPVHVPGMPKITLGMALLRPTFIFLLNCQYCFFGSLVNETFSNLKFNVFIITGSILVTNMWNKTFWLIIAGSPPLYKKDEDCSSLYSSKNGGGYTFFLQKREGLVK